MGTLRPQEPSFWTNVPTWPAYTPKNRATMWLDAKCEIVNYPDKDEGLFWKNHA